MRPTEESRKLSLHALLFSPVISALVATLGVGALTTYFVGQYSAAESRAKESLARQEHLALQIENGFRPERARLETEAKRLDNQIKRVEQTFALQKSVLGVRENQLRVQEKELGSRIQEVEASVAAVRRDLDLTRTRSGITGNLTELLAAIQPNATMEIKPEAVLCGETPRITIETLIANHGRFAVTVGRPALLLSTVPFSDDGSGSEDGKLLLRLGTDYRRVGSNLAPGYLQAGRSVKHTITVEVTTKQKPQQLFYLITYGLAPNRAIVSIMKTYLHETLKGSSIDLASAGGSNYSTHGVFGPFEVGFGSSCRQPV